MSDEAGMQADRHHLRRDCTFLVQDVEGVLQQDVEIVASEKSTRELHVIGDERIGHDKVLLTADARPVRQFVIVGVAVVQKAALLDEKAARGRAGRAGALL